jgi:hypothetical protein
MGWNPSTLSPYECKYERQANLSTLLRIGNINKNINFETADGPKHSESQNYAIKHDIISKSFQLVSYLY